MRVTPDTVAATREWVHERAGVVVPLVNEVRGDLGEAFGVEVGSVSAAAYHDAVDEVFADGDLAVNVAALLCVLRDLDVTDDYPGFVVDELLARELAAMVAGNQPRRLLAEATFHYADVHVRGDADAPAGADDLDAALAAGFQTRLPGWPWTETASPFSVVDGRG
ncbi:MAG: hypothetical protein ABEJ04_02365 [Halobacteriaceae archaeon]